MAGADSLADLERQQSAALLRAARKTGRTSEDRSWTAEARYRALVEQIPAVTFMAALDGGLNEMYVSPQIEKLLGYSQKEWLEDPILWYTRLHPEDRAAPSNNLSSFSPVPKRTPGTPL